MQIAVVDGLAFDAMFRDKVVDDGRGVAKIVDHTFRCVLAERFNHVRQRQPKARVHKAGVAAGAAESNFIGLNQCDGNASFGEMQSGGHSGEAAAHNCDGRLDLPVQSGCLRRCRRGGVPKAVAFRFEVHQKGVSPLTVILCTQRRSP